MTKMSVLLGLPVLVNDLPPPNWMAVELNTPDTTIWSFGPTETCEPSSVILPDIRSAHCQEPSASILATKPSEVGSDCPQTRGVWSAFVSTNGSKVELFDRNPPVM